MERDPYEGGSDVGRDLARDIGDEPPSSLRDAAPSFESARASATCPGL